MADYTEEQRVRERWPSARALREDHGGCTIYAIYIGPKTNGRRRKSFWVETEAEAWADAARRLGPLAERKEG